MCQFTSLPTEHLDSSPGSICSIIVCRVPSMLMAICHPFLVFLMAFGRVVPCCCYTMLWSPRYWWSTFTAIPTFLVSVWSLSSSVWGCSAFPNLPVYRWYVSHPNIGWWVFFGVSWCPGLWYIFRSCLFLHVGFEYQGLLPVPSIRKYGLSSLFGEVCWGLWCSWLAGHLTFPFLFRFGSSGVWFELEGCSRCPLYSAAS